MPAVVGAGVGEQAAKAKGNFLEIKAFLLLLITKVMLGGAVFTRNAWGRGRARGRGRRLRQKEKESSRTFATKHQLKLIFYHFCSLGKVFYYSNIVIPHT